jgi:hypothetical protein
MPECVPESLFAAAFNMPGKDLHSGEWVCLQPPTVKIPRLPGLPENAAILGGRGQPRHTRGKAWAQAPK